MNRRYIVFTPCRNEEKNLPNLLQSITVQTIRPALWVIVDDGSTDKTGEIITEAEKRHEWIKGHHLEEHKEIWRTPLAPPGTCSIDCGKSQIPSIKSQTNSNI